MKNDPMLRFTLIIWGSVLLVIAIGAVGSFYEQREKSIVDSEKAWRAQQPSLIKACSEACNFKMRRANPCECM